MAKLPSSNISNYDVASALGAGTLDVGSLCQHDNINKWSRYKPVNRVVKGSHTGIEYVKELTDEDFLESHYGLRYPSVYIAPYKKDDDYCSLLPMVSGGTYTEQELVDATKFRYDVFDLNSYTPTGQDGVFYGKPSMEIEYSYLEDDGSITTISYDSYARLSDFCGYDHAARNPVSSENGVEVVLQDNGLPQTMSITVDIMRTTSDYGGLTIDNWNPYFEKYGSSEFLNQWHIAVGLFERLGRELYTLFFPPNVTTLKNAFLSLGTYTGTANKQSYTFTLDEATMADILSNFSMDNVYFYSVRIFAVRDKRTQMIASEQGGERLYFYSTCPDGTPNDVIFFEGVSEFRKGLKRGLALWGGYGLNDWISLVYEDSKVMTCFTYSDDFGQYIRNPLCYVDRIIDNDYFYEQVKDVMRKPAYGLGSRQFTLYADTFFYDFNSILSRTVVIGDYYNDSQFFPSITNITGSDKYLPLIDVKVHQGSHIYDGQIGLVYNPRGNRYATMICTFNDQNDEKGIFNLFTTLDLQNLLTYGTNLQNFKTLIFQNILNDSGAVIGLRIRGINYNVATSPYNPCTDNDEIMTGAESSSLYQEGLFWYYDITVDNQIYDTYFTLNTSASKGSKVYSNSYDVTYRADIEGEYITAEFPYDVITVAATPFVHISNGAAYQNPTEDEDVPLMLSFSDEKWENIV